MSVFFWLLLFLAATVVDGGVLGRIAPLAAPSLTWPVIVFGSALQEFLPGFIFVGLAGLVGDAIVGADAAAHTLALLLVFMAMRLFMVLVRWDEPAGRIGAVAFGFAVSPLAWLLASAIGRAVFSGAISATTARDLASPPVLREAGAALIWFSLFSWLSIRRAVRQRRDRLQHL